MSSTGAIVSPLAQDSLYVTVSAAPCQAPQIGLSRRSSISSQAASAWGSARYATSRATSTRFLGGRARSGGWPINPPLSEGKVWPRSGLSGRHRRHPPQAPQRRTRPQRGHRGCWLASVSAGPEAQAEQAQVMSSRMSIYFSYAPGTLGSGVLSRGLSRIRRTVGNVRRLCNTSGMATCSLQYKMPFAISRTASSTSASWLRAVR